jgi:hypothetical protein
MFKEAHIMKNTALTLILLLTCSPVLGNSNFVSNPYLPYPPGCVRDLTASPPEEADADTVKFFDREIQIHGDQAGNAVPVRLEIYRTRCSEPGRSLIWLSLSLEGPYAGKGIQFRVPTAVAVPVEYWTHLMNLVTEPNGWGAGGWVDREAEYLTGEQSALLADLVDIPDPRKWVFLLDNGPPGSDEWFGTVGLTPSQYNGVFKLRLQFSPYGLEIDVPATSTLFPSGPATRLALSGRQSGIWVIEGAADQGFQLAIAEQVGKRREFEPGAPDLPLVIFFSQYTFDAQSQPMWLVGNAQFEPGANTVTIPIMKLGNGEFRGNMAAERQVVGSVTLTSNSCNDITFEYDYDGLGLGQGSKRLQRQFSLETAGYDCRDYQARVAANR